MSSSEGPDERLIAILAGAGIAAEDGASAWRASPSLWPLLGRILAAFGGETSDRAFDVVVEFVRHVGGEVGDDRGDVAGALAAAREHAVGVPPGSGPRGRVASELGDRRSAHGLAGHPALAALADAAQHIAEVWAAPGSGDPEVDPFRRARASATALVDALLLHRRADETDRSARNGAGSTLLERLRELCPGPP